MNKKLKDSKDRPKLDEQEAAMAETVAAIAKLKRFLKVTVNTREIRSWRFKYQNWRRAVNYTTPAKLNAKQKEYVKAKQSVLKLNVLTKQANEPFKDTLAKMAQHYRDIMMAYHDNKELLELPVTDQTYFQRYQTARERFINDLAAWLDDYHVYEQKQAAYEAYREALDKYRQQPLYIEKPQRVAKPRRIRRFKSIKIPQLDVDRLYHPRLNHAVTNRQALEQLDAWSRGPYENTKQHVEAINVLAQRINAPVLQFNSPNWSTAWQKSGMPQALQRCRDSHAAFGGKRNSSQGALLIDRFVECVDSLAKVTDKKSLEREERRFRKMQSAMLNWMNSSWWERGGKPTNDVTKTHWRPEVGGGDKW